MPLTVEIARSIWAVIEKERLPSETWAEACEREMYQALLAEGMRQDRMAEVMSTTRVAVNRRLGKMGARPRDKKHLRAV